MYMCKARPSSCLTGGQEKIKMYLNGKSQYKTLFPFSLVCKLSFNKSLINHVC